MDRWIPCPHCERPIHIRSRHCYGCAAENTSRPGPARTILLVAAVALWIIAGITAIFASSSSRSPAVPAGVVLVEPVP